MDLSTRKNEKCIIGMPRCDYIFNSSRACFIGYGFNESSLEREIVSSLLMENQVESIDAGSEFRPGQYAFCTKICSKIMTSQFCIILSNNDIIDGKEIPNANVNMEYGLMLGFNKYLIPFQREEQRLPFNVAALDTIKYNSRNFRALAEREIKKAIEATQKIPKGSEQMGVVLETYLASKDVYMSGLSDEGEKALFHMGDGLNFNLLNHYDGLTYIFFGGFANQRTEIIVWKIQSLVKLLQYRIKSLPARLEIGMVTEQQAPIVESLLKKIEIWILVANDSIRNDVSKYLSNELPERIVNIFTQSEVNRELDEIISKVSSLD